MGWHTKMKIEFGGGDSPRMMGWTQVDVRKCQHTDIVCDAWNVDQYIKEDTVTDIYSRHFFEHLTIHDAYRTLLVWHKILQKNGKLTIIIPDMEFHIRQWLNPNRKKTLHPNGMTDEEWAISGFWGKQRETEGGEIWDIHKSGYDFNLLKDVLEKHNYSNIQRVKDMAKNLHVTCQK